MKNVFVLKVGDYRPDLCRYTLPTIKHWAEKIGATYREITERKFPDAPSVTYEKMQVYDLGREADWNILIDADTMVHPSLPDLTAVPPYSVVFRYGFDVRTIFKKHDWFMRDGRFQGLAANFVVTPKACHDLWTPFDIPLDEAAKLTDRQFILDELCLSLNLARYGLKFTGLTGPVDALIHHFGNEETTSDEKTAQIEQAKALFSDWGFE